jgi:hypothetical protein
MPGVAESAVIGLPHPDFGEAVVAVVVARDGAAVERGRDHRAQGGRSPTSRCPSGSGWSELPRNAMGKVQKNLLRQLIRRLRVVPGEAELVLSFAPASAGERVAAENAFQALRRTLPDTDVYVAHAA